MARHPFALGTNILALFVEDRPGPIGTVDLRVGDGPVARAASVIALQPNGILILARRTGEGPVSVRIGDEPFEPLQPPQDAAHLAARMVANPRLLSIIASKAAGPLRAATDQPFLQTLTSLASVLAPPSIDPPRPVAMLGQGRCLWQLDEGGWLLSGAGLLRVPEPEAGLAPLPPLPQGGFLLRADRPPLRLPPGGAPASLVEMARQTQGAGSPLLRQAFAALRRVAAEPWAQDAIRDAQLLAMAPPRAAAEPSNAIAASIDRALSDHAGGVFAYGWIQDPLKLMRGMTLRGPFGAVAIPPGAMFPITRADVTKRFENAPFGNPDTRPGFVVHIPDAGAGPVAQWRMELALGSGQAIELIAGPALLPAAQAREAVLRAVNPLDVGPDLLDRCIAPAAQRLHAAASAQPVGLDIVQIGAPPQAPPVSIVIPLYRNLRFVRHQVAAFARDPFLLGCQVIMVLDSPEQRAEAEHLLRGVCGLAGLSVTLALHGRNAGYATACNSGASLATAPHLLQLNSDVIPDRNGWLELLLRRLASDRGIGCVGPKLMFDDGSLQHAGLYFARGPHDDWYNCHYFKGFPRHYREANQARRVPGVTGAAMLMPRAAWDEVGGFHADYIVGDYEDSDLCLRLRQAGFDIWYEPAAELFHFERQSIAQHGGYSGTVAAAYNRRLHHRRWADTIEQVMGRFPRLGETGAAA
jgi:GT2 family glycosyltransferase